MQSKRQVAEPAIVPSARVAFLSFIVTSWPPSSYFPFSIPVAIIESLIRITLLSPKRRKVFLTVAGWIWIPSPISSTIQSSLSAAAPITPGSLCPIGFMAL